MSTKLLKIELTIVYDSQKPHSITKKLNRILAIVERFGKQLTVLCRVRQKTAQLTLFRLGGGGGGGGGEVPAPISTFENFLDI